MTVIAGLDICLVLKVLSGCMHTITYDAWCHLRCTVQAGAWYEPFQHEYSKDTCLDGYEPGTASYIYPNLQRPSTAWYHDHT